MSPQHVSPLFDRCGCSKRHQPEPLVLEAHHVVPMGGTWQGPDIPENRVTLCSTAHHSTHALLDLYVRLGREPTAAEMKAKFACRPNRLVRRLAAAAWAHRPARPTYTS